MTNFVTVERLVWDAVYALRLARGAGLDQLLEDSEGVVGAVVGSGCSLIVHLAACVRVSASP